MRINIILLLIAFLSIADFSRAQPKSHIEHYNSEEGLPQRSVMSIMQDKKGFIWLTTWDGLCKFDGYNFTSFKTSPSDSILMKNNRIDRIWEDTYGYIWLCNYNRETFRFDPKTERYVATFQIHNKPYRTTDIYTMPSGKVWLNSDMAGIICVMDTLHHFRLFSVEEKNLPNNQVNAVFEDSSGLSWILTANGLVNVSPSEKKNEAGKVFFNGRDGVTKGLQFFSAFETETEIWFGSNNGQVLCYNKNDQTFTPFDTGVQSNIISIKRVYDNLFIILTSNDGFLICDRNRTSMKRYNRSTVKELPTNEMLSCYIDANKNIWLETNTKGVVKFNIFEDRLKYYVPNDYGNNLILSPSFFIIEDNKGHIWVHPHGGFSFYDEKQDKLVPFFNNPLSHDWKFSDMLHDVCLDNQGNIWMSTRSGGLEKIVFDNTLFQLNDFYSNEGFLTGFEIRAMLEDSDKNIWLGNMGGTTLVYDLNHNFKGYLCENGIVSKSGKPLKAMAYSFLQDKEGNIWIGTKGDGVFVLKPKNNKYDAFYVEQYKNIPNDIFSLSNDIVYSIHEDEKGRIWIGSYGGGINLFDPDNKRFINCNNNLERYPIDIGFQIRTIRSCNDKIFVGTTFGLIVLSIDDKNLSISEYKVFSKGFNSEDGIRANDIHNIYVTKDQNVYIATFGGGMSKVISWDEKGFPLKFKTYDHTNGLHSDIVLSITEDNDHYLWINSEGSLSKFNPESESFEQFNDVSRVIDNQYFMEAVPLLTSDGELIYGCAKGILSFYPGKIAKNTYTPYLALTKFKVSNEDYPLQTKIDDTREITLTYKENIFSIEYAALDYTNPRGIFYEYKLEGFDKNWVNNQKQRIANYTNIPPGEYIFKVRSTNGNGTWVDNERSLLITITPSFWQTKWAYLTYVILFVAVLYIILRSIFVFYRMKDKVALEQEETEMKTRFFTDISHEIRTPLTMIVSPIENILDNEKTHPEIKPQLQLILRNANRMLKMVNQILDFRKIQKQKLQIKEVAIDTYIEDLCNTSFKIAESQNVKLVINNQVGPEKVWIDPDAIEKLIFNLISNSVKHTDSGKKIEINLFKKDKMVVLQVKDEGEGMTKEVLNKLFTRFTSYSKDRSKPSTGIGLSIVKEIVDKHHAKVVVESNLNKGTCFTIFFQTGIEHFRNDKNVEIIQSEETVNSSENQINLHPGNNEPDQANDKTDHRLSVLIVEDDLDLRNFIKSVLTPYYQVFEAGNGREGYDQTVKHMPDFILSDIMMPEMDGIEFLQKVKSNHEFSHIPFILLTAKTSINDELEGITLGADDYITKPFNVKLLIAKIENILRLRKQYADYLSTNEVAVKPEAKEKELTEGPKMTEQDELFIKSLKDFVVDNLDNSDFTIDDLVNNTNFSRRVFFNKVKSLTGLAPVEFVREIRIKRAAQLIKTQEYRIKEVTYMVGFSDVRYFIQCFKDMYGMTPSQYKDMFKN